MTSPMLRLDGIAFIEMYVANAYQAAFFYQNALGFHVTATALPAPEGRDHSSVLLQQGDIRLLLTSGQGPNSEVAKHVHAHGDTVRDVAFRVDDAEAAFTLATTRGARAVAEPETLHHDDAAGGMIRATIGGPGDTVHSFVQYTQPLNALWPGFKPALQRGTVASIGLTEIDHVAVGLQAGDLEEWVDFYKSVLGFRQSHAEMVFSARTGMKSKVVEDPAGRVRFPIIEPATHGDLSQINEYLSSHQGAGAQHVAFATDDIVATMCALSTRGVRNLPIPATYYDDLEDRVPSLQLNERAQFQSAGVLIDSDEDGILIQAFTEPLHNRPTLFLEMIERRGARGFGARNIQALFEAVEREQLRRGSS